MKFCGGRVINNSMNYYPVYLYLLAACIAGVTLLLAYKIQRNYPPHFLSYYFYHLLLFNLGGFFVRPLQILLLDVLNLQGIQAEKFFVVIMVFITAPLFILATYLLIKFAAALTENRLSRLFHIFYFGITGGLLGFKVVLALNFLKSNHLGLLDEAAYTTDILSIVLLFSVFGYIITRSANVKEPDKRRAVKTFGIIYFVCLAVFNLSGHITGNRTVHFMLFFIYVLPPLVYLAGYFRRSYREQPSFSGDEASIESVFERYNISAREREVILLISGGKSNQEIADELYVSLQTIKQHTSSIYRKLAVKNRVQLGNFIRNASDSV